MPLQALLVEAYEREGEEAGLEEAAQVRCLYFSVCMQHVAYDTTGWIGWVVAHSTNPTSTIMQYPDLRGAGHGAGPHPRALLAGRRAGAHPPAARGGLGVAVLGGSEGVILGGDVQKRGWGIEGEGSE